ncbi:MAG: HAD family hydrolase [Alphaproteobacteria bacterium]
MMVSAVAWDIDGTLIDSEPLHLRALRAVCAVYDIDLTDAPDFTGINMPNVWKALGERLPAGLNRARWMGDIEAYYVANARSMAAVPAAVETVQEIHCAGIPQVAVSNSNRTIVDTNLKVLGLEEEIPWSLSLDDVERGKPDPLPCQMAAAQLGLAPSSMVAVEDSRTGAASASAAGLTVIGFIPAGGTLPHVDRLISSLAELTGILSAPLPA